jgi:hypothetical protein
MTRTKTTREILDEYERLAKEREERRFNQITSPNVCSFLNSISLIFIQSLEFIKCNNQSN